jgi:hypothetical protein
MFWGDVAFVVALEAAIGVNRVVERFINRDAPADGLGSGPAAAKPSGPADGKTPAGPSAQGKAAVPDKAARSVSGGQAITPMGAASPGVAAATLPAGKGRGDELTGLIQRLARDPAKRSDPRPAEIPAGTDPAAPQVR